MSRLPLPDYYAALSEVAREIEIDTSVVGEGAEEAVQALHGAVMLLIDRLWAEAVAHTFAPIFADERSLLRTVFPEGLSTPATTENAMESLGGGVFCDGPAAGKVSPAALSDSSAQRIVASQFHALVDDTSALADSSGTPLSITTLNRLLVLHALGSLDRAWGAFNSIAARGISPNATSLWLLVMACLRHGKPADALPVVMAAWTRGLTLPGSLLRVLVDWCARDDAIPPLRAVTRPSPSSPAPERNLQFARGEEHDLHVGIDASEVSMVMQARRDTAQCLTVLVSHLVGQQVDAIRRSVAEIKAHRKLTRQIELRGGLTRQGGSIPRHRAASDHALSSAAADKQLLEAAATATAIAEDLMSSAMPLGQEPRQEAGHSVPEKPAGAESHSTSPLNAVIVTASDADSALLEDAADDEDLSDDGDEPDDAGSNSDDDDDALLMSGSDSDFGSDDDDDADADDNSSSHDLEAGVEVNVETGAQTAVLVSPTDRNAIIARIGELDPTTGFSQAVAELAQRRQHREARDAERRIGRSHIHRALRQRREWVMRRRQRPAEAVVAENGVSAAGSPSVTTEDRPHEHQKQPPLRSSDAADERLGAAETATHEREDSQAPDHAESGAPAPVDAVAGSSTRPVRRRGRRSGRASPSSGVLGQDLGRGRSVVTSRFTASRTTGGSRRLRPDEASAALKATQNMLAEFSPEDNFRPKDWFVRAAAYDDVRRAKAALEVDHIVESAWSALRRKVEHGNVRFHPADELALTRRLQSRAAFACRHRLFRLDDLKLDGDFDSALAARFEAVRSAAGVPRADDSGKRDETRTNPLAAIQWPGVGWQDLAYPHPEMHPLLPPRELVAAASSASRTASDDAAPRLSSARMLFYVNVAVAAAMSTREP